MVEVEVETLLSRETATIQGPKAEAFRQAVLSSTLGKPEHRLPENAFGLCYQSPPLDKVHTVRLSQGSPFQPCKQHYLKAYRTVLTLKDSREGSVWVACYLPYCIKN